MPNTSRQATDHRDKLRQANVIISYAYQAQQSSPAEAAHATYIDARKPGDGQNADQACLTSPTSHLVSVNPDDPAYLLICPCCAARIGKSGLRPKQISRLAVRAYSTSSGLFFAGRCSYKVIRSEFPLRHQLHVSEMLCLDRKPR